MVTIQQIIQECINTDLANMTGPYHSVGCIVNGEFRQFRDKDEVEVFYHSISPSKLIKIYSQYMGLKDLEQEESLEAHGYTISVTEVLKLLQM